MAKAAQLPLELLHCSLDYVRFADVLCLTKVCRHWRQAALDHPKFWRYISVSACSLSALELFIARLSHSSAGRIRVQVELSTFDAAASYAVDCVILPAITKHLHRIFSLHCKLSVNFDNVIYQHLKTRPAPSLARFSLAFIESQTRLVAEPLPNDIFAATCPVLSELTLLGFGNLALSKLPPVLASARQVWLSFENRTEIFPVNVFSVFQNMFHLTIHGSRLAIPPDLTGFKFFSRLRYLNLQCSPDLCHAILSCEATHHISHLTISGTSAFLCPAIIDHISEDLVLTFKRTLVYKCKPACKRTPGCKRIPACKHHEYVVTVSFRTLDCRFTRTLFAPASSFHNAHHSTPGVVSPWADYCHSARGSILSRTSFLNRVVELELFADSWGIFSNASGLMPFCTKLTFIFDEPPLTDYAAAAPLLHCHTIAVLALRATCQPVSIRLPDIVGLLKSLPSSDTRLLVLDSVELVGDKTLLQGIARTV